MKSIITFLCASATLITYCQPSLDWAGNINTDQFEWVKSIKTDLSGNVYVFGENRTSANDFNLFAGTYTVPTSAGPQELFVAKYSSTGNILWAKSFGPSDTPYDMDIDELSNIYRSRFLEYHRHRSFGQCLQYYGYNRIRYFL